ncbi:MAG TPA: hypothetical protein VLC10_03595, partial [Patescibacteria group bacterium]|nr:hypothetical protein [Patescibacteria group bacterium]
MYASVIPALKLPRLLTGPFDYAIPETLAASVGRGSVVIVPWRGRKVPGLVVGVSETPAIDAKNIKPIAGLAATERAPDDLLKTFAWAATHYVASPATVVQCFIPEVPKRAMPKDGAAAARAAAPAKRGKFAGSVVRYSSPEAKMAATATIVAAALSEGKGVIVIVPHLDDVSPAVHGLRE